MSRLGLFFIKEDEGVKDYGCGKYCIEDTFYMEI